MYPQQTQPPDNFIAQVTRQELQGAAPALPLTPLLQSTHWLRIGGITRSWEASDGRGPDDPLANVLAALYHVALSQNTTTPRFGLAWLLASDGYELYLWAGLRASGGMATHAARGFPQPLADVLRGAFPGIEMSAETDADVSRRVHPLLACQGRLVGMPAGASPHAAKQAGQSSTSQSQPTGAPSPSQHAEPERIERVIRGMRQKRWAWLVTADALPEQTLDNERKRMLAAVRTYSLMVNKNTQAGGGMTATAQGGPESRALEIAQRMAQRFDTSLEQGGWQMNSAFCAPDATALDSVAALLQTAFSGPDAGPQRLRALMTASATSIRPESMATTLTTPELAVLLRPPRVESQGYALRPWVTFDLATDPAPAGSGDLLPLGAVVDQQTLTGLTFTVPREMLARHGLLAGVTRSGKTTTAQALLRELQKCSPPIPFLVIEPAKREYRDLLALETGGAGDAAGGLLVLTPGDEDQAPFRLNPFEFPAGTQRDGAQVDGIHVQQHLDYLKAAFNAAFAMYPPMPFVLERCLVEVYQDAGWDLVSGVNRRLPATSGIPSAAFPTLTDLHHKLSEVVERLRYDERIRRDVLGALDTRISSLRLGAKGTMLDTRSSLDMADLLKRSVVVELERIADDEEKAFLMSLLLVRLAEQRMIEASRDAEAGAVATLRHITLIEEAHRLLAQSSASSGPDAPATRAKAVETFASLLSELGGLGEGVLVAEQIPSKLVPDVIKNSGLKVAHRTVAGDDRQLLGAAMVMTPEQERMLATLRTGQAIVFADGMDAPMLIARSHPGARPRATIRHVQSAWERYRKKQPNMQGRALGMPGACPVPGVCQEWAPEPKLGEKAECSAMRQQVSGLDTEAEKLATDFDRALLAMLVDRDHAPGRAAALRALCQSRVHGASGFPLQCLLAHGMYGALSRRAQNYRWPYALLARVASFLIAALAQGRPDAADLSSGGSLRLALDAAIAHEARQPGPYPGCADCPAQARCHYRHVVRPLALSSVMNRIDKALSEHTGDVTVTAGKMRRIVQRAVQPLDLTGSPAEFAGYCLSVQAVAAGGDVPENQLTLLKLMK